MQSKWIVSVFVQIFLQFSLSPSVNCDNLYVECVDLKFEADALNWKGEPSYGYATTSEELPLQFRPKLDGHGIFYFVGDSGLINQAIYKSKSQIKLEDPCYLYLKYYGHVLNPTSEIYVIIPGNFPIILDPSEDSVWNDTIVQLNVPDGSYPEFGIAKFQRDEFLLIERFAIISGSTVSNLTVQEIEELCWSSTSTSTSVPETTVQPGDDNGLTTFQLLLYIVVPGIVLLAIIILLMYLCRRRKKSRKQKVVVM